MDGLNRRVSKDVATGTDVRYLYDGWRSIQEETVEASCSVLARYVYGLAYLDELVRMDRDAAIGGLVARSGVRRRMVSRVSDKAYRVFDMAA